MSVLVATMWDDGLESDLRLLPILEKYGATATFALCGIDRYGNRPLRNDARSDRYGLLLTREQLRRLAPYEICNHSLSHADLPTLHLEEAHYEIAEARRQLESFFERPIQGFCYPYGNFTSALRDMVRDDGYTYARAGIRAFAQLDRFALAPDAGCCTSRLEELIVHRQNGFFLLYGHTYELRTAANWEQIDRLYGRLTRPDVRLVTTLELATALYLMEGNL